MASVVRKPTTGRVDRSARAEQIRRSSRVDDFEQVPGNLDPRGRHKAARRRSRDVDPVNIKAARLLAHHFLAKRGQFSIKEIAEALGESLATAYRYQRKMPVMDRITRQLRDD